MAVDIEGAHAADTLAAVVVKHDGLLALFDEALVEDIEGLKERGVGGGFHIAVSHKSTLLFRSGLTPYLEIDFHYVIFHCFVV